MQRMYDAFCLAPAIYSTTPNPDGSTTHSFIFDVTGR